jgi:hypothetical protein
MSMDARPDSPEIRLQEPEGVPWIRYSWWVGLPGHQIAFNAPLSH